MRAFARQPRAALAPVPPVSILKPLHGDEPMLAEALETFVTQTGCATQLVFGVQSDADPALAIATAIGAKYPGRDIAIVIDPRTHGRNRKVCNLTNMLTAARHDVLLIADSDVHAAPDLVARMAQALAAPGVGLVTSLYAGLPANCTLPARLASMQIGSVFLPGALLARRLGRQDCLGATMMLRRDTLARIGGLAALSPHLADDAVLGRLVRAQNLRVALAPLVPLTTVPETTARAVLRHELRWFRTVRALEPAGFAASALQYPLAFAALAAPRFALAALAVWAARAAIAYATHHALAPLLPGKTAAPHPLLWPVRDALSLATMVLSYAGTQVRWRGHTLAADPGRPVLTVPLFEPLEVPAP